MTETPILPGGATATDAGVGMLPNDTDVDSSDSAGDGRRRLVILGAIAGVIVLAAAAYLLMHKGSSSTPTAGAVPKGVVHAAPPAKTHKTVVVHKSVHKGTHKGTAVPKVAKAPVARDPFAALVTAPVATNGSPESSTTVTAPTTAPTQPATTPTQPAPTNNGGGSSSGKSAATPLWIQLTRAGTGTATFKVGYAHHKFRVFTVQAPKASSDQGTVFAKVFALISVQDGQATVQIGDAAPFILTTGVSHVA